MKKKIISVLISLAVMGATCYADIGISHKSSSGKCEVSGSFDTADMSVALEILQKNVVEEELKNIDSSDASDKLLAVFTLKTDENGQISKDFTINAASGIYKYRYRATDGTIGSGSFRYSNAEDIVDFVRAVNGAEDTEELYLLLKTSGDDVNLGMKHYQSMGKNAQKYALSYIIKKDFADFEQLSEAFDKGVLEAVLKYKPSGEVILSSLSDYEALTNIANASCYDKYRSMDDAKKAMMGEIILRNTEISSIDTLNNLFDSAVVTAYVSDAVWTDIEEYITKYYDVLGISLQKYNALKNKSDVLKSLSGKVYYTPSEFTYAFNNAVNTAGSTTSGGGGGHSVSGGGGNIVIANGDIEPTATQSPVKVFTDTDGVPWAEEAIRELYKAGIVNGKTEYSFCPNDDITREEFLKLLIEGLKLTDDNAKCDFEDVPEYQWYYKYAASGVSKGIVNGISETRFGTGSSISRQDMAVMTVRALDYLGIVLAASVKHIEFTDGISEYAAQSVRTLQMAGIINGVDEKSFAPQASATRAQAAKIIYGVLKSAGIM